MWYSATRITHVYYTIFGRPSYCLADRRVRFDFEVPREVPTGRTNVIIQIPVKNEAKPELSAEHTASKKINMTREELDEFLKNAHTPISDSLLGILKKDMTLDEIRTARLAKHL
jgi:hypothetical protein